MEQPLSARLPGELLRYMGDMRGQQQPTNDIVPLLRGAEHSHFNHVRKSAQHLHATSSRILERFTSQNEEKSSSPRQAYSKLSGSNNSKTPVYEAFERTMYKRSFKTKEDNRVFTRVDRPPAQQQFIQKFSEQQKGLEMVNRQKFRLLKVFKKWKWTTYRNHFERKRS